MDYSFIHHTTQESDSYQENVELNTTTSSSFDSDLEAFLSEDSDGSTDNEDLIIKEAIKSSLAGKRPVDCDYDSDIGIKARTFVEEKMTKALVRRCWCCRRQFIKEDGCNTVTCPCGAKTCYHCRLAMKQNLHSFHVFCPLTSTSEDDNKEVLAAERRAKKKITSAFPSLNFNIPNYNLNSVGNDATTG